MSGTTGALAEAVGMGLLHFTWIGLLVGALLMLVLSALRGRTPQLRYAVALAGFIVLACAPVVTIYHCVAAVDLRAADSVDSRENWTLVSLGFLENVATYQRESAVPAVGEWSAAADATTKAPVPLLSQWTDLARIYARKVAPWIAAGWLVGVAGLGMRLLAGMHYARGVGRRGTSLLDARWQARLDELTSSAQMRRTVRVFQSTVASVPLVVGWFRPIILMPATLFTGLPAKQVELLLAHELAHIKRLDPMMNLFQVVVETLLFFHPVIWWLSRRIREERELCCDDFAVELCGGRTDYAQALLQLAESTLRNPALALSARGGHLRRRIQRILGVPVGREGLGESTVVGVLMLTLCGVLITGLAWAELRREPAHGVTPVSQSPAPMAVIGSPAPSAVTIANRLESAPLESRVPAENPAWNLTWPFDDTSLDEKASVFPIMAQADSGEATPVTEPERTVESPALAEADPDRFQLAVNESTSVSPADAPELVSPSTEISNQDSLQAPTDAPKQERQQLPAKADREKEQHLLFQLAEPVNMDFNDIPLREVLDFFVKGPKIDIALVDATGGLEKSTVKEFKFEDGTLAEALDGLFPTIGLTHWVGPGYILVGTPEQLNAVRARMDSLQMAVISTPPLVTDRVEREHIHTVLDRWAKRHGQYIYLDPFIVGAVSGPDGEPVLTDGMVGPADFDTLPMTEALRTLLTPLGLAFTQIDRESFPRIFVSTPEVLTDIEKGVAYRWTVEQRVLLVPDATADAISKLGGADDLSVSGNATRSFRLPEHSEWLDDWEKGRLVDETEELLTAPRLTLTDSRAWWSTTLFKVVMRSAFLPRDRDRAKRAQREMETLPEPGCFFPRGHSKLLGLADIAFSGIYDADDMVELAHEDKVDHLVEHIFRNPNAGLIVDLVRHPKYSKSPKAPNDGKPLLRAGRRVIGVGNVKRTPDSAYHQGYLFASSVSKMSDRFELDYFCQYREADMGEVPWRAFRSEFDIREGEYVGFVSPSEKEGMSIVTVVWVTPADEQLAMEQQSGM